jgi:DNA recombination protein RmuC
MEILLVVTGFALGALAAWALAQARSRAHVASASATVEAERRATVEKLELVQSAHSDLQRQFEALSAEALKSNNESFLALAKAQLDPVRESLQRFDGHLRGLEQARVEAYGQVSTHLKVLADTNRELREQTGSLVNALRSPSVRGRWGEMQLRRVVEAAGMLAHCDFSEQVSAVTDGRVSRPDLIVKLAGGKNVVVDAKAPLQAYLEALEAKDEDLRIAKLGDHARQLHDHILKLSAKGYWSQFDSTPEFVILFIPGETFYSAALEHDPALIEKAADRRVIIATPTTLIAVLWAIAHGWREERIAENARRISELGRDLHSRLATMGTHFAKLGRSLDSAVKAYNDTAASLESRVLVGARRFKDLGATATGEIAEMQPLERSVRPVTAPELVESTEQPTRALDAA